MTSMLAGAFCACTPESPPLDPPKVVTSGEPVKADIRELSADDQDQMRRAYLNASFDLLRRQFNGEQNVMISPASIMIALSMAESGAAGETRQQMASIWGGTGNDDDLSYAADLLKRLNSAEGVNLHAADSMWINEDSLTGYIKSEYVDFVSEMFDSEVAVLKFNERAVERINSWVDDNTDHMIDKIIGELDPSTALVLINAIAFDGKWNEQYEDHQVTDGIFRNSDGTTTDVKMLNGEEGVYLENDKATGFVKFYEGCQYAFVTILPKDESQSADDLLKEFTGDDFDAFLNSKSYSYEVNTKMPEFSYDFENVLNDTLKDMGMILPFEEFGADFTGIADLPYDYNLYISKVIHKTHIEVTRTGTRAAAVTAVTMDVACAIEEKDIKNVFCDRPFAYAIVDMTDNTPVFIGTVNNV